jgi:hypothetical protein
MAGHWLGEALIRDRPFKPLVESRTDKRFYRTATRRRIYKDEKDRWRKLVDEALGVDRYGRESQQAQEIGADLACASNLVQDEHFLWTIFWGERHENMILTIS